MRVALIANARSGRALGLGELEAQFGAGGVRVSLVAIEAIVDEGSGALRQGALGALTAAGAPDRVVVAGGDGSIGPAALCAALIGVPVAVLAVGTANDFARAKRLPLDVGEACALARDPLARTRRAELAMVGERPFVNAAAAGLSVAAARAAEPFKALLGPLAYPLGALRAGVSGAPLRCAVACDGEQRFAGGAWQVIVAVTGAFGGGSETGGTWPEDRLLDVAVVPVGSRAGLVRRAVAMRTGRLTNQRGVVHERSAVIDVRIAGAAEFNIDGEMCRCEPARFALRDGGFDVVTPS